MRENHWIKKIFNFLHLTHEEEDHAIVQETIEKGIVFRGTNLWILIFAILVASVGLNMNSTAVIIGAMLISPLMGPITGIGYSIATYNFELLKSSLKNYAFSGIMALIASTIYFMITPIHTEHSELLARTSPTIYDVLIALFGGLAGITAITSKNKGQVIPGVAIATALIPPLCTAGYGISIGNWGYFIGALFLFLINTVFIALAAMLVSQLLKFPKKDFLLNKQIKNTNIVVIIVILVTVLPSLYLGMTLVRKETFAQLASTFVSRVGEWDGNILLDGKINAEQREITLIYGGSDFDSLSKQNLLNKANDMGLEEAKINIIEGLKSRKYQSLVDQDDKYLRLTGEVNQLQSYLNNRDSKLDSIQTIPYKGRELLSEISTLYPQVIACSYAESERYIDSLDHSVPVALVYFTVDGKLSTKDVDRIENWVKKRLHKNQIIIKF